VIRSLLIWTIFEKHKFLTTLILPLKIAVKALKTPISQRDNPEILIRWRGLTLFNMFQLTQEGFANLKSQIATSSSGWGGRRKTPSN